MKLVNKIEKVLTPGRNAMVEKKNVASFVKKIYQVQYIDNIYKNIEHSFII